MKKSVRLLISAGAVLALLLLLAGCPAPGGGDLTSPPPNPATGWQDADIDLSSLGLATGSSSINESTFTVNGAGEPGGIPGEQSSIEECHFAYQTVPGDFSFTVRLLTVPTGVAQFGIMCRTPTFSDRTAIFGADYLFHSTYYANGGHETSGTYSPDTSISGISFPNYLRIVRTGAAITVSNSPDGGAGTWTELSSMTLSGTVYVGMFVYSGDKNILATAEFDYVLLTQP
jgi:hypothetical protein